jgi:capsular polysaccharide export protein
MAAPGFVTTQYESTRPRSPLFYFDLLRAMFICLRLYLLPKNRPVIFAFFANKAETALLPSAVYPHSFFVRVNFASPKRGWNAKDFEWLIKLLKRSAGARPVGGLTWGYRDRVNHQHDLSEDFVDFHRIEAGLISGVPKPPRNLRTAFIISARSVYFDGRGSTELEDELNKLEPGKLSQSNAGRRVLDYVLKSNATKYVLSEEHSCDISDRDLLIVGQCTGDQAIEQTAVLARTNTSLVDVVSRNVIQTGLYRRIYFKPHPKSGSIKADLAYVKSEYPDINIIDGSIGIVPLLKHKPTVCTITSGVGIEAALRGCSVHCFGISFYSNWGFTVDYIPCTRRKNQLTSEDVFLYLVLKHTAYVDWRSKRRVSPVQAFGLA